MLEKNKIKSVETSAGSLSTTQVLSFKKALGFSNKKKP